MIGVGLPDIGARPRTMRKLLLAFLLPKVIAWARRRYAGRKGQGTY